MIKFEIRTDRIEVLCPEHEWGTSKGEIHKAYFINGEMQSSYAQPVADSVLIDAALQDVFEMGQDDLRDQFRKLLGRS